jgi:hypothetical protein
LARWFDIIRGKNMAKNTEALEVIKKELDLIFDKTVPNISQENRSKLSQTLERTLWNSNISLIDSIGKQIEPYGNGDLNEVREKLRKSRRENEKRKRRQELLNPVSEQELESNLMWMAECGTDEDLDLLRSAHEKLYSSSEHLKNLLELVENRLKKRLGEHNINIDNTISEQSNEKGAVHISSKISIGRVMATIPTYIYQALPLILLLILTRL